jgi:hypothetical protein
MKRISIGILAAASLAVGAAGCSQNAFESVAVTKSPAAVASCEKVGDISAKAGSFDETDAATQLTRAARSKGANTILVASDDADKGTAYRCSMPSVASTSKASNAGSK